MEIKCVVVDFNIAKKVIEEELKNTEFADYAGIYKKDINVINISPTINIYGEKNLV